MLCDFVVNHGIRSVHVTRRPDLEQRECLCQLIFDVSGETRGDHVVSQRHRNEVLLFAQFQMVIQQVEPCRVKCTTILNLDFVSGFSEDAETQENIR